MNRDWLTDNPDYAKILKGIIEYEKDNKNPDHHYIKDSDKDCCWKNTEIGVHPTKLFQLETHGFLERVMDTNQTTAYTMVDREGTEEMLNGMAFGNAEKEVMHDFPSEEDLPDDLFDDIIGYDKVKWLLKRALTTEEIVNVLLIGPPGSAKTIFLLEINELEKSTFISGKPTSGPGVLDVMFNETPMYVAIDEFDDMSEDTQEVLSQHMDTGILDETKYGKDRRLKTNTNTFGSANSTDNIINQVVDRFVDIHFDPYTREEYLEICEHLLPKREGVSKSEAIKIAEAVWDMENNGDVRKAIAISRLSRGDPKKVVSVLDDYSSGSGKLLEI